MGWLLKCDEAQHICDKKQYKEASFLEKVWLKLHLLFCKICQGYTSNNGKLTNAVKTSKVKTLSLEEKERLRERLRQNS